MKILITSALPYVNNVPHLGNIIGCVLSADVYARFCRSRGYDCLYIGGTDEYGTATEIKALEEGVSPREICDKYHRIHKDIYEWFGISFDIFGRTSTPKHTELTQQIFLDLHKSGHVVEEEVEQFYDEKAGMFLADRYIEGKCPFCSYEDARGDQCDKCGKLLHASELLDPRSRISKTKPVLRKTRHLFIDLPGIEERLESWVDEAGSNWSENTYKIAKSWLKEGLKRRAITRDLKWGVPVPLKGFEDKVFYVWFDAPIGYISITAALTENWKDWWLNPKGVKLYNFIGKDNVPFHAVIFPSTLMGTGKDWTLVHNISSTEFLNYEDGKFSKSRNTGVFGDDAKATGIPPDVWRYYLLANRPESADTAFTWDDLSDKNNNELLANLGNLVNRTLVFAKNNFDGEVPPGKPDKKDVDFLIAQKAIASEITADLDAVKLREGIHKIMAYSKNANRYFQENAPWELVKTDKERAGAVIRILLGQVRDLSIMIEPYLPFTTKEICTQMDLPRGIWADIGKELPAGHALGEPKALFRKIEKKEAHQLRARFAGTQKKEEPFSFKHLDIEVGQVLKAIRHPDAEKLLVETVRMGDGVRQIVSGLVGHYLPEELEGRKVLILRNLKSAKLRGVESQGMLLVAEGRERAPPHEGKAEIEKGAIEVIFPAEAQVGDKLTIEGEKSEPRESIGFNDFKSLKIEVKDFSLYSDGKEVLAGKERLRMKNVKEGIVA